MMYSIDRKQPLSGVQLLGAVCLAVALTGLAGCSMGTMQMSGPFSSPASSVTISGTVHGGQQPILNSAIQLWVVGSGSYGAAATPLIASSVTSGSTGTFTITGDYHCPSASSLVYLTATGGNPGLTSGTNNAAIELASPLGACGNLSSGTFLVVNEVTTAAAAFALGQYFTPTFGSTTADSFGAPSSTQAQLGITNAFATAANLVSINSGMANASLTLTGSAGTITAVPEATKLNTVANILASCVDSMGASDPNGNCTTLFADSAPADAPGTTTAAMAATDTLQAAVYMSLNPTSTNSASSSSNIAALFALSQGTGAPYSGTSTQPTDWTIGIQYQDSTGTVLDEPQNIAADGNGNIWVLSNGSAVLGNLVELSGSAPGTPLYTNNTFATVAITANNPRNLAIDTNNDVWFTTSSGSGYVFEYTPGGTAFDYATGKAAYGLAINGNNDVFVGQTSTSSVYELYEFPGANISDPITYPLDTGADKVLAPEYMGFDTSGNLWMTNGSTSSSNASTLNDVVELTGIASDSSLATTCNATYPCNLSSATYTNFAGYTGPWAVAATTGGSMWVANEGGSGVYEQPSTGSATEYASGVSAAHYDAVDGSGNVWITTKSSNIFELNSAGTLLSPSGGYSHAGYVSGGLGVTIDPSGNVWVASNSNSTPTSVFELVGAATPTVTPIAQALATSKVAAKP